MRNAVEFKITAVACKVLNDDIKTVYLEIGPHWNDFSTFRYGMEFDNMSLKSTYRNHITTASDSVNPGIA
jgi:hypothetical protein